MNKNRLILGLFFCLCCFELFCFGVDLDVQPDQDEKLLSQKILDLNMQTFPWEWDSWESDDWIEFIELTAKRILEPKSKNKRNLAFQVLKEFEKSGAIQDQAMIDTGDCWSDLDLFCGKSNKAKFVANQIDRTSTEIGKVMLYSLLSQSSTDIQKIEERQKVTRFFLDNPDVLSSVDKALQSFKKSENVLLAFWGEACFKNATERNFFSVPGTKFLNKNEMSLLFKSVYDHQFRVLNFYLSAVATVVLTSYGIATFLSNDASNKLEGWAEDYKGNASPVVQFLWKRLGNKNVRASFAILAGAMCGMNLKNEWDWVYGCFLIEKRLQELLIYVAQSIDSMKTLYEVIKKNPELASFEPFKPLVELFEVRAENDSDLAEFFYLLEEDTFKGQASWFAHKGVILRTYKLMLEVRKKLRDAVCALGYIDSYSSVAKLMKEHENKNNKFSFAKYINNNKPIIKISGFWNPMLDANVAVSNSICLGVDGFRPNVIITGPNEGGKSTVLKSITLCLIMAQSIGVVPASSMEFTIFNSIATYLNISDDIGQGNSLFKAEVLRAQQLIDKIKNSESNQFCFVVFDEIFNGTSPVEGCAAAYSVAKYLAQFENSISMVATHFRVLTDLEAQNDKFSNYMVRVVKQEDGKLFYPYKLEHGIAKDHIALDILRNDGFSGSIIDDAQNLVNKLTFDFIDTKK